MMEAMREREQDRWEDGFASGSVYNGDPEHIAFLNEVYALNSQANPLHADLWPSTVKFEAEIVAMAAHMLGDVDGVCGTVSSGGTESILLADVADTEETLSRLRAIGVQLAMDDFGTGYSSLSYLERLPVDLLKIDRAFTASLGDGRDVPVLLRSIVKLGQTLGLQVLAEGIERDDQVVRLRELGCRLGQGYHFSPPLPADAVPDAVAHRWERSLSA